MSNLRQVTMAGLMYFNDTQGGFPYNAPGAPGYDPTVASEWIHTLTNYSVNDQIRLCPSTDAPASNLVIIGVAGAANLAWATEGDGDPLQLGSYGNNAWFTEFNGWGPPALAYGSYSNYFFPKLSSVPRPAQTPFFFDENYVSTIPLESDSAAADLYIGQANVPGFQRVGMGCCTIQRHGGRTATS